MIERVFMKARGMKRCFICQAPTHNVVRKTKKDGQTGENKFTGMAVFVCDGCMELLHRAYEENSITKEPELPFTDWQESSVNDINEPVLTGYAHIEHVEVLEGADIADAAVTADKIIDHAVTSDMLASDETKPSEMKFFRLKEYAKEKGLEFEKTVTKEELISMLEKIGAWY